MKNSLKGFVIPIAFAVVALIVVAGVYYFTKSGEVITQMQTTENKSGDITSVYTQSGKNFLNIDYIESLSGFAAVKAIIEDKKCLADSTEKSLEELAQYDNSLDAYESLGGTKFEKCLPPNGVYDRNNNPQVRTFEISSAVKIATVYIFNATTSEREAYWEIVPTTPMSWSDFYRYFNLDNSALRYGPYEIELVNNIVVKINQQFRP